MHENSKLEKWLRKRNMTTQSFANLVGCSRQIIWKAKTGSTICPLYANKIYLHTNGEVMPASENVGHPIML